MLRTSYHQKKFSVLEKEDEGWKSKKEGEEEEIDIIHKKEN
jgi:hypothetical protein